jgi:hypothetical protein
MRTSTQYFYPLTKPFSAAELPARREGEVVDYYVQDANGVTVVEYCESLEEAERIAAAMNGPCVDESSTAPMNVAEEIISAGDKDA